MWQGFGEQIPPRSGGSKRNSKSVRTIQFWLHNSHQQPFCINYPRQCLTFNCNDNVGRFSSIVLKFVKHLSEPIPVLMFITHFKCLLSRDFLSLWNFFLGGRTLYSIRRYAITMNSFRGTFTREILFPATRCNFCRTQNCILKVVRVNRARFECQ